MAKAITTVVYELKVTNPNSIANYDAGKLTQLVGNDLTTFVGKPMQGMIVKAGDATKIVEKAKSDMVGKKLQQPWLRAGISGEDMIFSVTDILNPKYEQTCVLVAGYIALRKKLKEQAGMVVNLDKGDKVIDQAAKAMAKAQNTKAVEGKDAKFAKITGTTPIVLLAHGDEDKTDSGAIYGKDFAGKTPQQLVALLMDNPDPKKQLSLEYAGTIYLDGCFTAQGGAMENYTKQVWELLKGRGVKNVKLKGNLGLAATEKDGSETITTSEADAKADKLLAVAQTAYDKKIAEIDKKLKPFKTKYGKDKVKYKKDPEVVKLSKELETYRQGLLKKLGEDQKKIPGYEVKDFVGKFGLEVLN